MTHQIKKHVADMLQMLPKGPHGNVLWIFVLVWVGGAVLEGGFPSVSEGGETLENRAQYRLENCVPFRKEPIRARLAYIDTEWALGRTRYVDRDVSQSSPNLSPKRAGSVLVGSIMALLATFEAVNVLPQEGTPQANQLIHGLIQLQSALINSQSSELGEYFSAAVEQRLETESAENLQLVHESGLTSKILEALVIYDKEMPMWDQPAIAHIFQRYNVSRRDWQLIEKVFTQADDAYRVKGASIHEPYEQWRSQMPGGGS